MGEQTEDELQVAKDCQLARDLVAILDSAQAAHVEEVRYNHMLNAYAALSRCRSLLLGAVALVEAGRADTVGVPIRALLEVFYFGVIALLGDDSDLDRLAADYRYWKNELASEFDVEPVEGEEGKFSVWQRAKRTDELVSAIGQESGVSLRLYKQFYAAESLTSAHAGFESLKQYVVETADGDIGIEVEPGPDGTLHGRLRMAVVLTTLLGKWTWERSGLDAEAFDQLDLEAPDNRVGLDGSHRRLRLRKH